MDDIEEVVRGLLEHIEALEDEAKQRRERDPLADREQSASTSAVMPQTGTTGVGVATDAGPRDTTTAPACAFCSHTMVHWQGAQWQCGMTTCPRDGIVVTGAPAPNACAACGKPSTWNVNANCGLSSELKLVPCCADDACEAKLAPGLTPMRALDRPCAACGAPRGSDHGILCPSGRSDTPGETPSSSKAPLADCPMCDGTGETPYTKQACSICAELRALVEKTRHETLEACVTLVDGMKGEEHWVIVDHIRHLVPSAPKGGDPHGR